MIGDIIQPTHLIFVLVVALLVLGPKRLPEVGRSLGRGNARLPSGYGRRGGRGAQRLPWRTGRAEHGDRGLIDCACCCLRALAGCAHTALRRDAEPEFGSGFDDRRFQLDGDSRGRGAGPRGLRGLTTESPDVETAALVALLSRGRAPLGALRPRRAPVGSATCLRGRPARAGTRIALL